MYTCPVCFYDKLQYSPSDYNICVCCGTEFENDDCDTSHDELRARWTANGARWFFGTAPAMWNPWVQLLAANVSALYPVSVTFSGSREMHQRAQFPSGTVETDDFLAIAS